jgi:hypothetical protein
MADPSNGPMISEVSICNQALGYLGANPITSFADQSTTAELCRNNYPYIRDAVLEERMWTFATARATSTVADLDPWGQMYAHKMPLGWISVFRCYRDVNNIECPIKSTGWKREGQTVLSKEATVYLWGIQRITDTGKFSPLFTQALAARMAAELAIVITESKTLQSDLWTLYQAKLADATTRDGQQGSHERIQADTYITARGRGGALR